MAAKRILNLFKAGVEATVRHWKKDKIDRFSFVQSWPHVGRIAAQHVADEIAKEEGLEYGYVEDRENYFTFKGKDDWTYQFQLKDHKLKVTLESPENSEEEVSEEGEMTAVIDCSEMDAEIKAKYGELVPPPETRREFVVREIAKLTGKPNKTRKQMQKLAEYEDELAKIDRDAAKVD